MTSFYVATAIERAADADHVADALIARGWPQTYRWTTHGGVQGDGEATIREVARAEIMGVLNADVVIVLLPGGRGTHAELGVALGVRAFVDDEDDRASRILFHSTTGAEFDTSPGAPEKTCAFYYAPGVERVVGPLSAVVEVAVAVGAEHWRARCASYGGTP